MNRWLLNYEWKLFLVTRNPSQKTFWRGIWIFPLAKIRCASSCMLACLTLSFHGLRCIFQRPDILKRIAYQSKRGQSKLLPTMRFDTGSFIIGINSFASVTMATRLDQFDNLTLHTGQLVQGIQGGLSIKGHGTFKSTSKMTRARYTWSRFQIECTYLTSNIASYHHNIGHKLHQTAYEGQEWRLTLNVSS